jgi:phospholipase/lecithinase/hemolysin
MIDFLQARRRALGIAAASAFALLLVSCGGGDAPTPPRFGTMVVFGASQNDIGNRCILVPSACPPTPPYAPGRASNGALPVELIAAHYGTSVNPSLGGGTNYSYSGANTGTLPGATAPATWPSMVTQLGQYLTKANFQASPQALYIVDAATFGNNLLNSQTLLQTDPNGATKLVTAGVGDIVNMVLTLYSAGARNILVINLPNAGHAPVAQAAGPATAAAFTGISVAFNGALAQQMAGLRALSAGLNLYTFDWFAQEAQVLANPAAYGLVNVTQMCFNSLVPSPPAPCTNPGQYYYWDDHHLTAAAYAIVAQAMITLLGD